MKKNNENKSILKLLKSLETPEKEIFENLSFYEIAMAWFREYFENENIDWMIEVGGGRGIVAFLGKFSDAIKKVTIIDQYMSDTALNFQKNAAAHLNFNIPEYHIAKLNEYDLKPEENTVIAGVHCCGSLSDELIHLAIQEKIPFAVMPCCHKFSDQILHQIDSEIVENDSENKAKMIDLMRIDRARQSGFQVKIEYIDPQITPKNRILLGYPKNRIFHKKQKNVHPVNATFGWNELKTGRTRFHHLSQLLQSLGKGELAEYDEIGGNRNKNVRLRNSSGEEFILRIARTNNDFRIRTLNKFEREARFYKLVQEKGVPVPKVIHIDASAKFLKDVFMVTECLPGISLQKIVHLFPKSVQQNLLEQVGTLLSQVHQIKLDHPGFLETKTGIIKGAFYASDHAQLAHGINGGLRGLLRKNILTENTIQILKTIIEKQLPNLEHKINSCQLFHGDFDLSNVLVVPDGENWRVSGLIDGEFAAAGDADWDLISLEFNSIKKLNLKDAHKPFFSGYGMQPDLQIYAVRGLIYRLMRLMEFKDYFRSLNGKSEAEIQIALQL